VTVSDDVPANVTVGASLAAAAFIGVGDFPVLFTYNAQCGFVGVPTCSTGSSGNLDITYNFFAAPAEGPLPAALPLFATGLGALGLLTWRRKRKAIAAKFEVLG